MLIVIIVVFCLLVLIPSIIRASRHNLDFSHLGEESFQKFAKFFGFFAPKDKDYDQKMNAIYDQILYKKNESISDIAKKSGCTVSECVMKIRYLKNKKIIGDYFIDTNHDQIVPCDAKDEMLLNKYKPYIYHSHLQVREIVTMIGGTKEQVYDELKYLDQKGLLNGMILNDIDDIVYYSVEKKKLHSNYVTVHCPSCGAINDVDIHSKTRCGYCKTIIVGDDYVG